jgi:signal peptidase
MEPTYFDGDLLVVVGVGDNHNLKPLDIIIFHDPFNWDRLIVHRIVEVIGNDQLMFRTKGDNNPVRDPWTVRDSHIIGVVITRLPAIGSVFMAMRSDVGKVFTVIILIIVVGVNILYEEEEK